MESLYISNRTHVSYLKPVFLNLCGTADPLLKIVSFDLIEYEVTKLYYLERIAFFVVVFTPLRSWVSSGSIVSDYGLDDRAIGVRSPAGARDFSPILCVQTGSGAHPASCTMGTVGPFLGAKRGRDVTMTTHPHLVPRS
jgi:hypothetical protein